MIFDVLVVGAGPAGATLAYHLALRGLSVRLIEKARLPRYKTCGGGLTAKALANLPFDLSPAIEVKSAGGILAYAGRQLLKVDTARPIAWLVMRDRFDHFLVERALEAGAGLSDGQAVREIDFHEGQVTITTQAERYSGRILVGADGVNSIVARSTGLLPRREVGVAMEAELVISSDVLEALGPYAVFDFGALPYGYGWIFPKREHLSVGIMHARAGKVRRIREHFEAFVSSHKILQEHTRLSLRGHLIPLGGRAGALHKGNTLLVGDAANLADAWLGEGLHYAILSGRIAAQTIYAAFEDGSLALDAYSARVEAEILAGLRYARIFAWLVYHLPRVGMFLTRRSEFMQDAVFGVMRGDISFQELIQKLAGGLPRILGQALARVRRPPSYRYQP